MLLALSLCAALAYGAADFCGGLASRRTPALAVVVWSQAAGLLVLAAALPMVPGAARWADAGWDVACGIAGALAIALLYRGLAIGTMGVVSPITAVLAAALPAAWSYLRGERLAPVAIAGIVLALVAVVLVSAATPPAADAALARPVRRGPLPPGIAEALGAGVGFGFFFIALAQARAGGGLWPLLTTRLTSLAILVAAGAVFRRSLRVRPPGLPLVLAAGALDMSANVLYVLASHVGSLSIAAVVTSLYPAGTVALAALVVRERLLPLQWAGVAVALGGVACISVAR